MKLLLDFFPILLFFIAYKVAGIYVATGVAIFASAAQIGWTWVRRRQIENMALVTLGLLVVFGGLTIALRDPIFLMWKPSILNWLFGLVFLLSLWIGERSLAERLMGAAAEAPPFVWTRLTIAWSLFFFFLGLANLYVVYIGSGYFEAQSALIAATGSQEVDLTDCAARFAGDLLALCQDAQAKQELWVNFKLFGMMGLTILFAVAQGFYLARHMKDEPATAETD
jgi:intracellular septation protein